MPCVLLTGKDWKERALLRAQLLSEGVEVEARETVEEALDGAPFSSGLPLLLVADLGPSERPEQELDLLLKWAKRIPVWIVLSRTRTMTELPSDSGVERTVLRPIDVGAFVREIIERVKTNLSGEPVQC